MITCAVSTFKKRHKEFKREIEVRGHLIDSMILTRIFDKIMDLRGEFEVIEFNIGKGKADSSYAKLIVKGKSHDHLQMMLEETYREGALPVEVASVNYVKATRDGVLPDDFYSTTNNPTYVLVDERWIELEDQMMDKAIILDLEKRRAKCRPITEVCAGDNVVVGDAGIRIVPPERPREGMNIFQFMSSYTSTEKPVQSMARRIAEDIFFTKKSDGKIAAVVGPAVVHTGATECLAGLIRSKYLSHIHI